MRRAEKEVKDLEQLEEILRDCNTVRIGTQDAEGMFIVPVNYGYDLTEGQLTLYLHSAREGRKAAAFRRGGAVAFEMDGGAGVQLQLCLPQHHGQRDHPGADRAAGEI